MNNLELKVIIAAVNKFVHPVKAISDAANEATTALRDQKKQLKELEKQDKLIQSFRDTDRAISVKTNAIKPLQAKLKELKSAMDETLTPSKAMVREFERVRKEAATLKGEKTKLLEKAQRLRTELEKAGTPTRELGKHQKALRARIVETSAAVDEQDKKLKTLNETLRKKHAAEARYEKTTALRNNMAGTGAAMAAGGAAMGAPVVSAVKDYSKFEDAMLGVARQVEGARNAAGQLTPVYYEMAEAIKSMGERIPMATTEIAALVEAAAKMGIQGKENLLNFAEITAITATAFDLPADQVGEDMAKLAQLYKVPIANIAELGDTINWLDDGAQSSGADIIEVMTRIAGTADGLGMAYQEAAALGSTFLSLGAGAEVAASASNAMMRELSIATMQSKTFQEGINMLGLNAGQIQLSMSKDSTGTILQVLESIRALPKEKQIEATTRLFGKEFGDDAAKLANNLDEYRKQLALVRDEEARGSMAREAEAKKQALSAQYLMTRNSIFSVTSALGETLKPALVEIMQATASVLSGLRDWMKENPGITSVIMKTAAAAAAIVTVFGVLGLAAAAILGPFAMLRYGMSMISIAGAGPLAMLANLGRMVLPMVGGGLRMIALAFRANPVGAILVGIATAIASIVLRWDEMKAKFSAGDWSGLGMAIWQGLEAGLNAMTLGLYSVMKNGILGLIDIVKSALGIHSPSRVFAEIGGQIIDGLWQGLAGKWESLKAKVAEIASSISGVVKEKLGIQSPSRVFAELGAFTMAGLEQGIASGQDGPLKSLADTSRRLVAAGAVALAPQMATAGDVTPPLQSPAATAASALSGGDTFYITIQAPPGADEQTLARLVEQVLDKHASRQAASKRARMTDPE